MKKKAIKIATASVVAASSFAAVAPFSTEAASSVPSTVAKAVKSMKAAKTAYKSLGDKGKVASVASVQKAVNQAKADYSKAKAALAKYKGKDKSKLNKQLMAAMKDYHNATDYIKAVNYASGLKKQADSFAAAAKAGKSINASDYAKFKAELAKATKKVMDQIVGLADKAVVKAYITPALSAAKTVDSYLVSVKSVDAVADVTVDEGSKLEDVNLPKEVTVTLVNGKKAQKAVTWDTKELEANLSKPGDYTVKGAVADTKLEASVKVTVNAVNPKVESVSAINATQVVVKFNKEVDETDAETVAKYSINSVNPATAELGSDKKSVTLTFANAAQVEVTNAVLVVEPVKLAADTDKTTEKYTQVFTYKDTVKPEIASVEAKTKGTAATSVTVKATEPIQSALAKIDGSYVSINFGGTDTATITGLNLDATKEHTIELINLTDKATTPNVTVSTSKTFTVTVDSAAPTVTVSTASEKELLLTFNKKMDEASLEAAFSANGGLGLVKDETLTNVQLASYGADGYVKEVAGSNGTKFTVKVGATLFANKTTRTLTVLIPDTVTDYLGNKIAVTTQTVTLTKDTTKPVPTGYKVVKNSNGEVTAIEVMFSEGLKANATPAEPTIVNMNGVDVTASFLGGLTANAIADGDKKVTFTAAAPAKLSGKYAFSFGAGLVTDQAEVGNTSDAFNYTIDFGASASTFKLTSANAANNVITVEFGRPVKGGAVANSATDVNNYTLGGKPLPQGTTIVLDAAQDTATITLPAGTIEKTDSNAVFTVANVMSLNGEMLETYTGTVSVVDNVKPVLTSAALTADNKLVIGFSEDISAAGVQKGDFVITINGKDLDLTPAGFTGIAAGTGSDAGKYVADLTPYVKYDGSTSTYIDADLDNTRDADEVVIGSGDVTSTFKFTSSPAITSFKVATKDSGTLATVDKSTLANPLKNGTVITVK